MLGLVSTCSPASNKTPGPQGIHEIQHVVIVMQENRSFDSYFGTYPGADGIPRDATGNFAVCMPDPETHACVKPYHNSSALDFNGPHATPAAVADIDGGKMDGFIAEAEALRSNCTNQLDPTCTQGAQ